MLDIDGRPDVDACIAQFLDVLPPLGVAAAFGVGVREFVDQQQFRLALQRAVEVELAHRTGPCFNSRKGIASSPSSKRSVSERPCGST